jgi:hypothetical protein
MTTSTWNTQPATDEWNTADNWTPAGSPTDRAVFSASSQTRISFSPTGEAEVASIEFDVDAPAYTFTFASSTTPSLTISGEGVTNRSPGYQSFIVAASTTGYKNPQLKFCNTANAGGDSVFYCAGPVNEQSAGGGVISFCDSANAGSASFKVWTGAAAPENSTVGGEVSFSDASSAGNARFFIYGSLGTDGDTFGNAVFHDTATADNATFTNVGGTVSGGDGGNTQFYGNSTAASGKFYNYGGTHAQANGGDVAFDSTANGGQGDFHNYAAKAVGAYGGVTSFNNNPPEMTTQGASAGKGSYYNYGARGEEQGGGGHVEFSAKHGSPTAADGRFYNYGSAIAGKSSAGHTIFSITLSTEYYPTAANALIYNHPAESGQGAAGYTEFAVFGSGSSNNVPTAGDAVIINLGASIAGAAGGYTQFSDSSSAGNARLVACGGSDGGRGGQIIFYDDASGGTASVELYGEGELKIGDHTGGLTIGSLDLNGGVISTQLGTRTTCLTVTGELNLNTGCATFSFWKKEGGGFAFNTSYVILTGANLSGYTAADFRGNSIEGVAPSFTLVGNELQVTFQK